MGFSYWDLNLVLLGQNRGASLVNYLVASPTKDDQLDPRKPTRAVSLLFPQK